MLKNKWILLIGATGGIGEETTKYLYESGYNLVFFVRDIKKIKTICSDFLRERTLIKEINIKDENEIKNGLELIYANIGKLDGIINCSGTQIINGISLGKIKDIKEMFEINVFSVFLLLKYFFKKKYFNEGASCILLSSIAAHEGAVGNAFYAASKGALEGLLKSAVAEIKNKRRINIISPGVINSGMGNKYCSNLSFEQVNTLKESYPLGLGEALDVVYMIEYLLSDKAKWITGQNFILDGGHLSL